ncbi:hypothetical protein AAG587_08290 [Vreelandella neptunia]|uniref:hypothetical protein n=1 Tax=Vreelandella neptunia TaxID=115551 RepID=UPI00315B2E1D
MINWIRDAIRGCRDMPYVGSHPGTPLLVMMTIGGFAAGWSGEKGTPVNGLAAAGAILVVIGFCYLCGAVGRARLSDKCVVEARRAKELEQ